MRKFTILFLVIPILGLLPSVLGAQDFTRFELSARAAALGGAFVARADDATALFFNPAGIAFFNKGIRLKTSVFFSRMDTTTAIPNGASFKSNPFQVKGSYWATWGITDGIALGVSLFSPYLAHSLYPWNWPGEMMGVETKLNTSVIRSVLAVRSGRLSLGVGFDFVSGSMDWWHSQIYLFGTETGILAQSIYETKGNGTGFVVGALWKPWDRLQIGARYQHKVLVTMSGTNVLRYTNDLRTVKAPDPVTFPMSLSKKFRPASSPVAVNSQIILPRDISAGILCYPLDDLALEIDFNWKSWTQFGDWMFTAENQMDETNWAFVTEYYRTYGEYPKMVGSQGLFLNWRDTLSIKLGASYTLTRHLILNSGYARHPGALDAGSLSPVCPSLDRQIISMGLSYEGPLFSLWSNEEMSGLSFDIFLQYAFSNKSTSEMPVFPFTYDSDYLVFGFSAGINL
jgi:long-chain fatty acid transport protein